MQIRISRYAALLCFAFCLVASFAAAQEKEESVVKEFLEKIENFVKPDEKPDEKPGPKATDPNKQKAAQLLAKHMKLKYERRPSLVLDTLGREIENARKEEKEKKVDEVRGFSERIVVGDWKAIKEYLAGFDEKTAAQIYDHMLSGLNNDKVLLLSDEIFPLADAAPADLTEGQLTALGRLLARSIKATGESKGFLSALEAGTERLGGGDPEKRMAAARLLLGAGMVLEAYPFLPLLGPALHDENAGVINLHALYHQTLSQQKKDRAALDKAWDLTLRVLDIDGPVEEIAKAHREAVQRGMGLLASMPEEIGDTWLGRLFENRYYGLLLLSEIAKKMEAGLKSKQVPARKEALDVLRRAMEQLLVTAGKDMDAWKLPIEMMTLGWIREAELSLNPKQGRNYPTNPFPPFTPEWYDYQLQIERMMQRQSGGRSEFPPIAAKDVLAARPHEAWLDAVEADLSRKSHRLIGKLAALAADDELALGFIRNAAESEPDFAKELGDSLVRGWIESLGPRRYTSRQTSYPPGYMGAYREQSYGIPLTRARQVRNIQKLGEILGRLGEIEMPSLDPGILVQAFDACHSPAEVYREEDIERVFGDLEKMPVRLTSDLIINMRGKLAGQWRKAGLQKEAGTKRTDKQLIAEIMRGYELAVETLERALERYPESTWLLTTMGAVLFDQSEFLYGQMADLKTYTSLRNQAFDLFRKAAGIYASNLYMVDSGDYSVDVYHQWFQSALGASDLAYLTRQDKPDLDQIETIARLIREIPGDAVDRHLALFGERLNSAVRTVPPQLKPRYFREGLRIIGDHEGGNTARDLLKMYEELLSELELAVVIDGSSDVGHDDSFGAHVFLRYTTSVGRESGGFNKYLRNKVHSSATGQQVDYQDEFADQIRMTMGDAFEVENITFHEPDVGMWSYGRPGWKQTPLAYMVLKVKDPSADRIPELQIDLDFNDGRGYVLLPVRSDVILIDARMDDPPARPVSAVTVKQLLDDRALATDNVVRLEVSASGTGLIPPLDQFLDLENDPVPGFTMGKVDDFGLNIVSLSTENGEIEVNADRSWVVEWVPVSGHEMVKEFAFPTLKNPDVEVVYQRYADADIVDVAKVVPLSEFTLLDISHWPWYLGWALVILLGFGIAWFILKRRASARAAEDPRYTPVTKPTPFVGLSLLKRMHADGEIVFTEEQREELASTIKDLEQRFFAKQDGRPKEMDLEILVNRWVRLAGR